MTEVDLYKVCLVAYHGDDVPNAEQIVLAAAVEIQTLRAQLSGVRALCDQAERGALRWEHPLPVPEWVEQVRAVVGPTKEEQ